jgi:hypothetical protein
MNSRWLALVSASLVAFAIFAIAWQVRHYNETDNSYSSIAQSCIRGEELAEISDIVERDRLITLSSGSGRKHDLVLPKDARIFMTDMIGPTNYHKNNGYYVFLTYYLFPREVATSLDHKSRLTKDGFLGKTSDSDQEILSNGFDIRADMLPGDIMVSKGLHYFSVKDLANPDWFDSASDLVIAFLLPLLTALAGMWLFRLLFPGLSEQMPLLEQLACSLGLGMMAVAALTLGIKLCGFSGRGLILSVTALGSVAEIWRDHKILWEKIAGGYWKLVKSPISIVILVFGLLVFLILFRLAGLQGLVEFDAVMAWSLKAKIMHLYSGKELVQWFSNPRLAVAHLDYPTLVPSLHSATYDSIGHVDEFVTKFWPTWMLLFLLLALASLNCAGKSRFYAPHFGLLAVLLLPATQRYVQFEGGTLPMVFFTVMGFIHCALWLVGKDSARLGLGLTFLFGAAMAKFEGFIFLALMGSWMVLLPSARPSWKPLPRFWPVLGFCFLAALPFVCLRLQIPTLNYESSWAGHVLQHPITVLSTLSNWASLFKIELARLFVSPDFANWNGEGGQLHWIGQWDGLSSLYNPSTLALGWLCLFMSVALWFAIPARRQIVVWILTMFLGAVATLSAVFACFINITSLNAVIGYTVDAHGARYLLPMLLAWFATLMTVFFAELPSSTSISSTPGAKPSPCAGSKPS